MEVDVSTLAGGQGAGGDVELASQPSPQLQREALEDWYGRLHNDANFPQHNGQGAVEEPLACLRMLSRHCDLPFRRDVLRRILQDQLQRSSDGGLPLQALAAICDLLGLRTTALQPNSVELIGRAPYPAITVASGGHPLVLWEARQGDVLVGDPRQGQQWVEASALLAQAGGERLQLLCVERSSSSPKARFGLGWFVPAIQKHRGALLQVVVTSFLCNAGIIQPTTHPADHRCGDRQGNFSSLNVLGTLLVAMALAQALLSPRTYLFSDTTNRIDISLGLNHSLPVALTAWLFR